MRIRKKKHLDERILAVSDKLIKCDLDYQNVKEAILHVKYLDYYNLFKNDNPVSIEIGCGKGGFIVETAKKKPNMNFIAIELLQNIIVMAVETAKKENLNNLIFFNSGAEYLPRYIKPNTIENIYLNFSPPFSGKRYENRRLTNPVLVENYKNFLVDNGKIYQKTDNKEFFDYSLNIFKEKGFLVEDVSETLNQTDNVETEYEKKFKANEIKIYALIATKKTT